MSQDTISLTVESRKITGKSVKHLRKEGKIPAVIHDHGKASIIVQGDAVAMLKVYRSAGKHHPVVLKTNSGNYTAMIKIAEFEPRKHMLNHIVFNAVSANQKVEAEIPIAASYNEGNEASPAERSGLMVLSNLDVVMVEALPNKLPDILYYDGEKLIEVGDHATVADLIVPDGVEIKTDLSQGVASVFEPSAVAAANDAAGGDEETEVEGIETDEKSSDDADETVVDQDKTAETKKES